MMYFEYRYFLVELDDWICIAGNLRSMWECVQSCMVLRSCGMNYVGRWDHEFIARNRSVNQLSLLKKEMTTEVFTTKISATAEQLNPIILKTLVEITIGFHTASLFDCDKRKSLGFCPRNPWGFHPATLWCSSTSTYKDFEMSWLV